MLTILKIGAAAGIAVAILNPGVSPRAEDCECKAKADALRSPAMPRAEDCECKAKADGMTRSLLVPRAEDCECKAEA